MSKPQYLWRQLTPEQREEPLAWRRDRGNPWHSPPHRPNFGHLRILISAACFEHQHLIGKSSERMEKFSHDLLVVFNLHANQMFAWCVLPNHYHALVEALDIKKLIHELGQFHGRTSHAWNGADNARGRKVFFRTVERAMRSDRHFWATLNYVHHNPVRHGYVERWADWLWSSASAYLMQIGVEEAKRIWLDFPIRDYGKD
jgi:REP-associated tyrosine transposase